jgi:hypothetical protein
MLSCCSAATISHAYLVHTCSQHDVVDHWQLMFASTVLSDKLSACRVTGLTKQSAFPVRDAVWRAQ